MLPVYVHLKEMICILDKHNLFNLMSTMSSTHFVKNPNIDHVINICVNQSFHPAQAVVCTCPTWLRTFPRSPGDPRKLTGPIGPAFWPTWRMHQTFFPLGRYGTGTTNIRGGGGSLAKPTGLPGGCAQHSSTLAGTAIHTLPAHLVQCCGASLKGRLQLRLKWIRKSSKRYSLRSFQHWVKAN